MKLILILIAVILVTIGLVKLVDKFIPSKLKPLLQIVLWILIAYLGYNTFQSIYAPIEFNKVKNERYQEVIKSLNDIRDAQLAHRKVSGNFSDNFDNLVKFIDTAKFTITQRRDTSVIDPILTKQFGVDMYEDKVIIDTLAFVSVKDSLFKNSDRYKTMMNVPVGQEGAKFQLKAGYLEQNDTKIPVFEVFVKKDVILFDQDKDLLVQENQVISVDGVNGDALRVGSMDQINTSGNWPQTFGVGSN
ncbi:hypothetical protein [Oceanihabitans sp. IOP_32]|uniref:hypothetical protein n=1 Tax=Oceanihabitans sp. IOP_32 TaxID=2529032 RepID=UPI0039774ABF